MIESLGLKRLVPFQGDDLYDKILSYLYEHPHSRQKDVIRDLDLTVSQAQYRLFILMINGLIEADTSERKRTTYSIREEIQQEKIGDSNR